MKRRNKLQPAQLDLLWQKWGTYLSERQSGTAREDFSNDDKRLLSLSGECPCAGYCAQKIRMVIAENHAAMLVQPSQQLNMVRTSPISLTARTAEAVGWTGSARITDHFP